MLRALVLVTTLAACSSSSTLPAGAVCKANGDCDTPLSCLDVAQFNGSACTVVGKSCSHTCTDDASCAGLGSNFKCFATCTTDKVCEMAVGP